MTADDYHLPGCIGKLAFDTQKNAQDAARVASYRYGNSLKTYQCPECGLWHIATSYD